MEALDFESANEGEIFRGIGIQHDGVDRLPAPPPWRDFGRAAYQRKGTTYIAINQLFRYELP